MRSSVTPWRSIATIVDHSGVERLRRDLPAGAAGMDAVDEQRLGSIHVADAADHLLFEQQLPDRRDAASDRLVGKVRLRVVTQRVGTETLQDPIAIFRCTDRAVGRARQIDGCFRNRQTHSHGRRVVGCAAAMHAELAEQAEVHVADQPIAPR